jgi:hypothetical protein
MYQRVSRSPTLDLAKTDKVATLEVAVAVLKLPHWRLRGASVENIANFFFKVSLPQSDALHKIRMPTLMETVHIELSYKRRNVRVLKVLAMGNDKLMIFFKRAVKHTRELLKNH